MTLVCICDDWIEGMEQITAAQELSALHDVEYTAKPFWYCPWCGESLVVEGSVVHSMLLLGKAIKHFNYAILSSFGSTRGKHDE